MTNTEMIRLLSLTPQQLSDEGVDREALENHLDNLAMCQLLEELQSDQEEED